MDMTQGVAPSGVARGDNGMEGMALVHRGFERQAALRPEAIAVAFEGGTLDYATLNRRANQVAHRLIALGVVPDDRVALCMTRSPEMAVALLGVLKAGGAYVPLDPAHPADRLAGMLDDSRPRAVLTQAHLRAALPAIDVPVIVLDDALDDVLDGGGDPDATPTHDPQVASLAPEHLAYVIYTSGSTGRPKGVMVPHAGVAHYLRHALAHYLHDDVRGGLVATSLGFDATVTTLLAPWMAGRTVVLLDEHPQRCIEQLLAYCAAPEPWLFKLTPTHLDAMSAMAEGAPSSTRHRLVVGGEQLTRRTLNRLRERVLPDACVINEYGPTETVVGCTVFASESRADDDRLAGDNVPIGRAIDGMQVHLLDDALQPVGAGDIGELYIGGAGVTRGYLDRPELTAERFLRDPFSAVADARMYRTGDLARQSPDGVLAYIGRNDFQVKVRGYRIEPGEIESVLAALPGVAEAVVLAPADEAGGKRLVAWYRASEEGVDPASLRDALSRRLPEYMVPAAYVAVNAWPQTVNGKLDRTALPAPDASAFPADAYCAPEGDTETTLAALWAELLRQPGIGRDDRFLLRGGDSLLLIQLASRIRVAFRVALPIHALFRSMTLAEMARLVDETAGQAADTTQGVDDTFDHWVRPAEGLPERAPLSFQQYGLWLLEQLSSTSIAYNAQNVIRIRGKIDPQVFGRAVDALVERHEVLRTTFQAGEDGEPCQTVHPRAPGTYRYRDLQGQVDEAALSALIEAYVHHLFDLSVLPLIRFELMRLSPDEYLLIQIEQHYVHDGWSMNMILRELLVIYDALTRDEAPPLPAMPVQFRDFALWQNSEPAKARLRAQALYWKRKLEGAPLQFAMPTDFPRPPVQSFLGRQVRIELPIAFARQLRAFCKREGVTLFATMQAVYRMMIARHIGSDDFVIGSAVANRASRNSECLVGMFVNMIPARCDVSGDPTWRELIQRVMVDLAEDYENQEVPFEWVVREVQPERDFSRNPLFQTAFSTHNSPGARLEWPDFSLRVHEAYSNGTSKFDFDVVVIPRSTTHPEDGITMFWEYSVDLYRHESIERLHAWYEAALAMCIEAPGQRLSEVEPLPAMRARGEAGGLRPLDVPVSVPVQARFEAFAARTPDVEAVRLGDVAVSYGALNARANRLAHWLRAQGVAPEQRVAIVQDKSIALVESVLATLKSGGAYLPLDVATPPERLARVLRDAAPTLVLTDAAAHASVAQAVAQLGAAAPRVVRVDADAAAWADMPAHDPDAATAGIVPASLAYVIYTSGSTGEPKGVMVEHRQIAAICAAWEETYALRPGLRHLQMASPAFDVFTADLLRALAYGGTLVLCPMETVLDAQALYRTLRDARIDVADFVPAVLDALSQHVEAVGGDLRFMATVVCGSDVWSPESARRARAVCGPSVRLINAYGLTETGVDATCHVLDADDGDMYDQGRHDEGRRRARVPIGRPLPGVRALLLDARLRPVPEGAIGELYIGGAGVARGYLNRDDLTATRFIDNPFAPGERLYRTGDLARLREDGAIEHLGRNDAQLKIRGHRIEPGEIEARLATLPGVREALVVAQGDGPSRRLVAYCLRAEDTSLSAESLRAALRTQLPEHMVPSAFVGLSTWPLTANGKIDRRALPQPDAADAADAFTGTSYVAPRTPMEEEMCNLWARRLGVPRVGVHDNFFALGGHSLMATRLLMEVHSLLGVELRLRDLFDGPTVERMLEIVFARVEQEVMVD